MRGCSIEQVEVNGRKASYQLEPRIGRCDLVVDLPESDEVEVIFRHGPGGLPSLDWERTRIVGTKLTINASRGRIAELLDPAQCFEQSNLSASRIEGRVRRAGQHTLFVRVREQSWEGWLPVDLDVALRDVPRADVVRRARAEASVFEPVDISAHFNCSLTELHTLEYRQPRSKAYSIQTMLNGRFGWDWNQGGFNETRIDDSRLRASGARFTTPGGIAFATPAAGPNLACASVWENFPTALTLPVIGRGQELAVFFIGVTNPMQSRIENARMKVMYADGEGTVMRLVPTLNFDDWLNGALQQENETVYFSDANHGIVARLALEPERELIGLKCEGIANEVILGVIGVSILR
jgi:hypothetical protein